MKHVRSSPTRPFYFRFFALVLALMTVASLGVSFSVSGEEGDNILSDTPVQIITFDKGLDGQKSPHRVNPGDVYGMRLSLGAPFNGIGYCLPTWSTTDSDCTLSLYAWNGTFDDTIAASPIATERFENVQDCRNYFIRFDEQPAGEYYFCIEQVEGTIGTWMYPATVSNGFVYDNGLEAEKDLEITVCFTKTPKEPFGKVISITDVDGNHTAPEEYVIPDDSLIYTHTVMPDTWVFTDGLGRVSLTNAEVGDPREDRTLALFYWTWHGDLASGNEPLNVNDFIIRYPEAQNDYNHPAWPTGSTAYFWDQPIYGYYRTTDEWVLRHQAELLANAGVDVIFTDNTNGAFTWRSSYLKLYDTWDQAQQDGVNVPKVSYLLPFGPNEGSLQQIQDIYLDIYRPGRYQNLWYYLDGKPMLMGYNSNVNTSQALGKEINNFFTFRNGQAVYKVGNTQIGQWGWLSTYPQAVYYGTRDQRKNGIVEQMTVGVSANFDYVQQILSAMNGENITGRSYTTSGYHTEEGASNWGYFFAEQFEYALEVDPLVLFVTGWNEWTAGRQELWGGVTNAFADEYIDEYSRDLEPTRGALKDHYYYQFVNFVRQYKGARPIPTPSLSKVIDINAGVEQWANVEPYYAAYIGNTGDRDAEGYGSLHYTDTSGRNDLIGAQVARDEDNVYFLCECQENISPYTDPLWMVLYIDSDQNNQGWESFDYVINKTAPTATTATLERFTGNGYETVKVADVSYTVDGRYMQIAVPKSALGLSGYDFTINFSWTDNVHDEADAGVVGQDGRAVYSTFSGDILDFYTSGDVAPGGRFKFSYTSTNENAGNSGTDTPAEETTAPEPVTDADTTNPETTVDTPAPADETTQPAEETTKAADKTAGGCTSSLTALPALACLALLPVAVKRKKKQQNHSL